MTVSEVVRECLSRDLLRLAVQPIVNAKTGEPVAGEVLLRPAHPYVPGPATLIDMAIATDMLDLVTRRVLGMVRRLLEVRPGRLFINLHPRDLENPDLPDMLGYLQSHAVRVTLEITEAHRLLAVSSWRPVIDSIRRLGFDIALDDLGEGYSSLVALAELRPTMVKLGRGLITGCHGDPWKIDLLEHVAGFCHRVGIISIAEGVETPLEASTVARVGIDWAQGYLFARPTLVDLDPTPAGSLAG